MESISREVEREYNLVSGSLKYSTLQRYHRKGEKDAGTISNGRPSFLPRDVEINLMKLVLACDERGDRSAGDRCVRHAMGLYIKDTMYENKFRCVHYTCYFFLCVCLYMYMCVWCVHKRAHALGKTTREDMTRTLAYTCQARSGTIDG